MSNEEQKDVIKNSSSDAKNTFKKKISNQKPLPVRQEGDPIGYNPGREKVIMTAKAVKRIGAANMLFFDEKVPVSVSLMAATISYPIHLRNSGGEHVPRAEWPNLIVQMVSFMFFKQFVSTMPPRFADVATHFNRIANSSIMVPTGLLPLVYQFGSLEHVQGDLEVIGQPILASTMLLRALAAPVVTFQGVNQNIPRGDAIGIDASQHNVWQHLAEFCGGVVNQWTMGRSCTINNNGNVCMTESPKLISGFETFWAAYQGTNFPLHVMRAIRVGVLSEGALRMVPVPHGGDIPAAMVQALNAEGYFVFNWNSEQRQVRFSAYIAEVQNVLMPTFDELFVMAPMTVGVKFGGTSQLVVRSDGSNAFVARELPGTDLEMGFMLSTPNSGGMVNKPPFRVDSEIAVVDALSKWFEGMRKGKKNG